MYTIVIINNATIIMLLITCLLYDAVVLKKHVLSTKEKLNK